MTSWEHHTSEEIQKKMEDIQGLKEFKTSHEKEQLSLQRLSKGVKAVFIHLEHCC